MRIVRFKAANGPAWGELDGDTLRTIDGEPYAAIRYTGETRPVEGASMLAPCAPGKIIAGGLNYHGHAREVGVPSPEVPVFFLKPSTSIIGSGEPVEYPEQSQRLEYEAELAVVIGRTMRRTPPEQVFGNIFGYTCVNDVTARDIQVWGGNFLHLCHSKAFDTFCPTGPWIETELDPSGLDVRLTVNGEVRQSSNTSDFIFPVEQMVSYFSHVMTLHPGDLVLTGTPEGTGEMKVDDLVELSIEGIGTLSNRIVRARA